MGLQNRMFATFMLLVLAFLTYQAMANFILQRDIYEARERASNMYSWVVFMLANIVVELPWNSLARVQQLSLQGRLFPRTIVRINAMIYYV